MTVTDAPASAIVDAAVVAPKERPKPKPIKKVSSICVDVVRNTHDTVTLYFDTGDQPDYVAGQFISIDPHQFPELSRQVSYFEHVKGKREMFRAYSMASAPSEKLVSITVKAEGFTAGEDKYPPLLSPFLASESMKGRTVNFTGYTGPYTLADDHDTVTDQVLHFVAGSGVVPNYALLKDELLLGKHPSVKHTMVYVNKTSTDIIFHKELEQLAADFKDRFTLWHLLTRETIENKVGNFRAGRPTLEWIQSIVTTPSKVLVYACGAAITKHQRAEAKLTGIDPNPRFMEGVEAIVHGLGVDKERFWSEEYG